MHIRNPLERLRRKLDARLPSDPTQQLRSPIDPDEDIADRTERLLNRRLDMDARRGPFGEYSHIYQELADLDAKHEAGKISDDDFAVEKRRILEGPNPEN